MHRSVRRAVTIPLLILLLSGAGCKNAHEKPVAESPATPSTETAASLSEQELAYGRAPDPDGNITFKKDVVIVGGGAAMVRSVSGDSLTWLIDGRAPRLDELKPGKVMFLTGRAVGRVLDLERRGDAVAVTLGPVDLTDIISDGNIVISAPIDVSAMTFQTYPGVPGLVESSPATVAARREREAPSSYQAMNRYASVGVENARATYSLVSKPPASEDSGTLAQKRPLPPPTKGSSAELTVGDFSVELSRNAVGAGSELSAKLGYNKKGVVVGVEFETKLEAPSVDMNLGFSGGTLARKELRINGLKEISVGLVSGSETGLSGNFKSRLEIPAEMTFPLPGGPIPLVGSIRFKFIVTTAFSAKNSTLSATGKLKLDGPIGFVGDKVLVPTVSSTQSPVESMEGVSVGVNAVIVAAQIKSVIGLGIPAALAGPFAAVTVSYGMTNGSSIGIVKCRQTSIDVVVAGGAGYTLAPGELKFLELLKTKLPWPPKVDSELASGTTTVVHRVDYEPKVPVCRP
ncbi:MAG TPA: hypothetical protein VNM92_18440 [Thermoanaerobaculia bacterium]|nr:hypothetical protein [Thermoanaerobaculia bacterium]